MIDAYEAVLLTVPSNDPDLICSGSLYWENVTPNTSILDSFEVCNDGSVETLLNWYIGNDSGWGTWTFIPSNGTNLIGGDCTNVQVIVTAPENPNSEYIGIIKIYNSDNTSDFCEIPVYLKTPRNKTINTPFQNWLENYLNLFPIL